MNGVYKTSYCTPFELARVQKLFAIALIVHIYIRVFSQAGDTRIPLPRKIAGTPTEIVDCKVGLCTSLQTAAEFL